MSCVREKKTKKNMFGIAMLPAAAEKENETVPSIDVCVCSVRVWGGGWEGEGAEG